MEATRPAGRIERIVAGIRADARVVAILTGSGAARVAREVARALAARRQRTLLLDLAPPDGPLAALLGARGAAGLSELLRGEAVLREIAMPSDRHGFIYVPPGRRSPAGEGPAAAERSPARRGLTGEKGTFPAESGRALHPTLRRLVRRAAAAGALVLLHADAGDPTAERLGELADGTLRLGPPEEPGDRWKAAGAAVPGGRRVIAGGRWSRSAAGRAPPTLEGGRREPSRQTPGQPGRVARGGRHRSRRAGRRHPHPPPTRTAGLVALPLTLVGAGLLLTSWLLLDPDGRVGEDGQGNGNGRAVAVPSEAELFPGEWLGDRWTESTDSARIRLPASLPFSTFSTGYVPPEVVLDSGSPPGPKSPGR
ncbi:MAG: hypothetical protein ACE5HP_07065 [Gemmatimonadota bacterium]